MTPMLLHLCKDDGLCTLLYPAFAIQTPIAEPFLTTDMDSSADPTLILHSHGPALAKELTHKHPYTVPSQVIVTPL